MLISFKTNTPHPASLWLILYKISGKFITKNFLLQFLSVTELTEQRLTAFEKKKKKLHFFILLRFVKGLRKFTISYFCHRYTTFFWPLSFTNLHFFNKQAQNNTTKHQKKYELIYLAHQFSSLPNDRLSIFISLFHSLGQNWLCHL